MHTNITAADVNVEIVNFAGLKVEENVDGWNYYISDGISAEEWTDSVADVADIVRDWANNLIDSVDEAIEQIGDEAPEKVADLREQQDSYRAAIEWAEYIPV